MGAVQVNSIGFLKALEKLVGVAEKLGLLTMIYDTIEAIIQGKPDEAKRRAERGAKAALARKAIKEA